MRAWWQRLRGTLDLLVIAALVVAIAAVAVLRTNLDRRGDRLHVDCPR